MPRSFEMLATALLLFAGAARADHDAPSRPAGPTLQAAVARPARDWAASWAYAVPEPSGFLLMAIGSVGLLGYRWRRRMLRAA